MNGRSSAQMSAWRWFYVKEHTPTRNPHNHGHNHGHHTHTTTLFECIGIDLMDEPPSPRANYEVVVVIDHATKRVDANGMVRPHSTHNTMLCVREQEKRVMVHKW